jgi:hypothetical protein
MSDLGAGPVRPGGQVSRPGSPGGGAARRDVTRPWACHTPSLAIASVPAWDSSSGGTSATSAAPAGTTSDSAEISGWPDRDQDARAALGLGDRRRPRGLRIGDAAIAMGAWRRRRREPRYGLNPVQICLIRDVLLGATARPERPLVRSAQIAHRTAHRKHVRQVENARGTGARYADDTVSDGRRGAVPCAAIGLDRTVCCRRRPVWIVVARIRQICRLNGPR